MLPGAAPDRRGRPDRGRRGARARPADRGARRRRRRLRPRRRGAGARRRGRGGPERDPDPDAVPASRARAMPPWADGLRRAAHAARRGGMARRPSRRFGPCGPRRAGFAACPSCSARRARSSASRRLDPAPRGHHLRDGQRRPRARRDLPPARVPARVAGRDVTSPARCSSSCPHPDVELPPGDAPARPRRRRAPSTTPAAS